MANEKLKLTALWEKNVNGKKFFTGYLGDLQIEIWPNGFKKEEKHPDWIVYLAPKYKKDGQQGEVKQMNNVDFGPPPPPNFNDNDNIPF